MKRVLLIEDDRDIVELVRYNLEREGFQVAAATDGATGLAQVRKTPPDLLLLDLMLPKLSGLEICREIRRDQSLNRLPILMLTARGEEADRVVGLEMGADDYVTKPFSPRELLARVRAAVRRLNQSSDKTEMFGFDDVEVNFSRMELHRSGELIPLTPQEFKMLRFFLNNPERVISRTELLNEVWGYNNYPTTRTVDTHILRLRQKLERDPTDPVHFRTVHGTGYKFVR
jgi:two-component system alkaline phosphatase synthesis response regulator PhoP